jgi:hypothetical protein
VFLKLFFVSEFTPAQADKNTKITMRRQKYFFIRLSYIRDPHAKAILANYFAKLQPCAMGIFLAPFFLVGQVFKLAENRCRKR